MTRKEALEFISTVRRLAQADATLLAELNTNLSPAEQSVLRSFLREAGETWAIDYSFQVRTKGATQ